MSIVKRRFAVLVSNEISSPMAAGFLRPEVMVLDHLEKASAN